MQKQLYDPAGLWSCTYQNHEYGAYGTLDECMDMVKNYITTDIEIMEGIPDSTIMRLRQRRLKEVRNQCLTTGEAGKPDEDGDYWWSISYEETQKVHLDR